MRDILKKIGSAAIYAAIIFTVFSCASPEEFQWMYVLIFIPGLIIISFQFREIFRAWYDYKQVEKEESIKELSRVLPQKKIHTIPYVMTLRTLMVGHGINSYRAGPAFMIL